MKDIYDENDKTLVKETEQDTQRKGNRPHIYRIEDSMVYMSILPKAI